MKIRVLFNVLTITAVLMIFSGSLSAQSFTGTLLGKVSDNNGASIVGATVTVTQQGTNFTQTTTTNDEGEYILTQLQPGTYTVKIEATNFKSAINSELVVETDQNRRFDVKLEAGNITETVTVEDTPSVINTETPEKGEVITPRQVQDLPLNGRNFTDLALLVPGVYPRPSDDDQGAGVAASGARTDSTNFILDGTTNRSDRQGGVGVTTGLDSIREFKVSTSNYSAEYGKVGGAQINVVSKSGTNRFSGTLFEYVRNDYFDALDVFSSPNEGKKLIRNQFGGTFGGPLPFFNFGEGGPAFTKGKDKTFFFVSYERSQQIRSESAQSIAPNAAWLQGDFRNIRGNGTNTGTCVPGSAINTTATNPCNDDTNRVTCLSRAANGTVTKVECPTLNVIPFTVDPRFPNILPANPLSLEILKRLPAANVPGSLTGYRVTLNSKNNGNQFLTKFDHRINEKNNFYIRFTQQNGDSVDPFPSARNFYPTFGRTGNNKSYSFAFSDTHIFSPRLVNEFRFGYLNQHNETLGENSNIDYVKLFGITGLPTSSDPALQGYPAIRIDGFSEFGDRPNDPFIYTFKNFQIYNAITWIAGNHNIKVGADILRPNYIEADIRNVRGDFRFRGRNTNPTNNAIPVANSFADFLYGLPDTTQRQIGATPADLRGWQYSFFVQDDWRIKPWLTINLGVRYDLPRALTEKDNRLSNFLPDRGISVCAGGEVRDATGAIICRGAADLGLPTSLVATDKNNIAPRIGFALRPFKDDKTVIRGGAGIFYSLESINPARQILALNFPYIVREQFSRNTANLTQLSFQTAFPDGRGALQGLNTPQGLPTNSRTPEIYQYNLTIERELAKDLALEIGYVGTQAHFLGLRYNLNAATPIGVSSTGTLITTTRFPNLGEIQYQEQIANSYYHGLQSSLRRRVRNGLTLLVSYTFSKAMDENSNTNNSTTGSQRTPQNIYNIRGDYGLSDFHRTHQFSASFNYDLPFGKGKMFFNEANGLANALVSGWQLNGIVSYLSGRPYTPQFITGDITQQRPDLIGDPYQNVPEGFLFNPFAFARPNSATGDLYGNAGRSILIGPTYNRTDLSLFKNFRFSENVKLQLRWEVFNVFNRANFKLPTYLLPSNISAITTGGTTTPAITLNELRNTTNIGRPTELSTPMREMQFAFRLIF